MKRTVGIIFITILLCFFMTPVRAAADYETDTKAEMASQFDELLSDLDIGYSSDDISGLTFSSLVDDIKNRFSDISGKPLKLLGTMILVIAVTAVLKSVGGGIFNNSGRIYSSVCILTAVAVIAPQLFTVFGNTLSAVKTGGSFVAVYIPILACITAAAGNITSAGVYDISVLAASELIIQLASGFLMPLLSAVTMLSVTGGVFSHNSCSGAVQLIKKLINWGLTVAMTLFTGFVTLKCTLAGKTDGAVTKTARFMISGLVPVVGGAVSDAYATVRSSFDVIRGTIGTGGCFVMILLIMPPLLQILVYRAVLWTGAAAADLFGEEQMNKLLNALDSGLAIAQSLLICYGLMFILCTGILMQTVG